MRITHRLLALTAMFAASLAVFADTLGTVNFIVLSKEHDFIQTGPSTVTEDATRPFRFKVEVDATNASSTFPTPPNQIISTPAGSEVTGTLSLTPPDEFNNQWQFRSATYSTATDLNADFGSGT